MMTGVSVWVLVSPNVKSKTNGLSYTPPLPLHTCSAAVTPTLQGTHAKNTRNHGIPDWSVRACSVESAEVKSVFYPSVIES